jgi:CheY-like chemotaxis protein/nitrogen-specific signal transduction histidine kinase
MLVLFFYKKLKAINANLLDKQCEIENQKKNLEETNKQLIEANKQAERMSNFKNQFLANISHEIRTPLNAITGYSKLLAKNITTESNSYYINQVTQAADNMTVIISDLLDFSKIEAGKMVLELKTFNPVKIITQTISTLKFRAEEKNIQLEIHIDPFIPQSIIGDPQRLSQILVNLINNAIKYSNDGQVVTIEAKCENHGEDCTMQFAITDKGVGIPELKLDTIFESFTQVTSDTSRIHEGTGLGLSIVKRLIELQHGTISVKSKVKEGSTFSFAITYKIAMSERDENSTQNKPDKIVILPNTYNILLVEDNLINQELAKDTIASWKEPFVVDIAENGKEAIMALQKKDFHLVLMDIQMPIMDGHEATQYIRNSLPAPKCNVPIIGMTAHAMSSEKELALKNGMNEYIIKPFNPEELKQKIIYFVTLKE